MVVVSIDNHRVPEVEGVSQPLGKLQVDAARLADLDLDQALAVRGFQQAGDLEPAELELVTDLDLGPAVEVVPAGHGAGEDQLGRSYPFVFSHRITLAHLSGDASSLSRRVDGRDRQGQNLLI